MKELFRKPYLYWVVGIFIVYMTATVLITGFYETAAQIPYYWETLNWAKLLTSIGFATAIGILVAINSVLLYTTYTEQKNQRKAGVLTSIGLFGGLTTGICPLCIAGVLPSLFGLFGVTFSWAFLPFGGLEVQILTLGLLTASTVMLTRKKCVECKK